MTSKVGPFDIADVRQIPDGTIVFRQATKERLDVKMQINDMLVFEYHNNNGLTKSTFRLTKEMQEANDKVNPLRKYLKNKEGNWPVSMASCSYPW